MDRPLSIETLAYVQVFVANLKSEIDAQSINIQIYVPLIMSKTNIFTDLWYVNLILCYIGESIKEYRNNFIRNMES